jgi:hypothetical protein
MKVQNSLYKHKISEFCVTIKSPEIKTYVFMPYNLNTQEMETLVYHEIFCDT